MKALLDSSVLVASFYEDHEHHLPSLELLLRHKKRDACLATHSFAEVYATLTAMPGAKRVTPAEAVLFLESIRERLTAIAMDGDDYIQAAELAAESGASSGGIYDAIIGQCFLKSRAEFLYTWNLKHFQKLRANIGKNVRPPTTI